MWPIAHYKNKQKAVRQQTEAHYQQILTEQRTQAQERLKTINKLKTQLKKKEAVIKAKEVKIKELSQRNVGYGGNTGVVRRNLSHGCSGYVPGQCVYGVCKWLSWVPDGWGSAYEWDDNARRAGYYVGSKPRVGAVGQTDAGWWGHVVAVLKVKGNQVQVRGMNESGPWTVKVYWTPISRWTYIY